MSEKQDLAPEEERELTMRVIMYVKKHNRVTLDQIRKALDLDPTDQRFLFEVLTQKMGNISLPNHIVAFANRPPNNREYNYWEDEYQLVPTALFSYVDYLEIKEARRAAVEARHLSLIAIIISAWGLVIGTLVSLLAILIDVLK